MSVRKEFYCRIIVEGQTALWDDPEVRVLKVSNPSTSILGKGLGKHVNESRG